MFLFHSSIFSFSRRTLALGALCVVGVAAVGGAAWAQTAPKEKVKVKAGAPELGEAKLELDPSPYNIAVDDCSETLKGLNQYVITDELTTSVSVNTTDVAFTRWFGAQLSWDLQGNAPALKRVDDVETISTTQGETYKPVHFPDWDGVTLPPAPVNGILFDVKSVANPDPTSDRGWNFPADNSGFGVKTFRHIINLMNWEPITAPVALFYPSGGVQHPTGNGLKGYYHLDVFGNPALGTVWSDTHHESYTPNWFHYYGQAFTAPYGTEINYRPENADYKIVGSGYTNGQNHVHIGENAHGSGDVLLLAKPPGQPFVVNVGSEASVGIDTFARVVTHECTHKRMYEMLRTNLSLSVIEARYPKDEDADGVPDEWEELVGLNPGNVETIRGFSQDDSGNGASPDNEVFGRMTERGLYADINSDWADDGLNWKGLNPAYRYLRCQRSGEPRMEDIGSEYQTLNLIWYDARAVANTTPTR